jgi:hypothetical protein
MNKENLRKEIREHLAVILSMDPIAQREAVEKIYEKDCHLETPYIVLQGREEIAQSYISLSKNNMDLIVEIGSITFDDELQTLLSEVQQIIRPRVCKTNKRH